MTKRGLTEDELIRVIRRTVKKRGRVRLGIGDDAAILLDGTVVTTDAYAEGVHFDLSYMTLRQVGERCACGAISDVVAMAAEPEALFVSLTLPLSCQRQSAGGPPGQSLAARGVLGATRELYRGIDSVSAEMSCEVAGGDIIVADRLQLALTATGKTRTPKLRSGARPGDRLYVTGHLGSAEAGRMLLAGEARSQKPDARMPNRQDVPPALGRDLPATPRWARQLVRRHLRPMPRLAAMRELRPLIHGLTDTSDGLGSDARHLSEMSRVKIVLDSDSLPIEVGTTRFCFAHGLDAVDFVLNAGEDYELLFTAARRVPNVVRGVRVTAIGSVERGRGLWISRAGRVIPVPVSGYDHLTTASGKTCH